jgi:hypothetical protein
MWKTAVEGDDLQAKKVYWTSRRVEGVLRRR